MVIKNKGLRALTTSKERQELRNISTMPRKALKLTYRGQMLWSKQYGIDSRLWDVVEPKLANYDYSCGGYPTLTIEGLKKVGLI